MFLLVDLSRLYSHAIGYISRDKYKLHCINDEVFKIVINNEKVFIIILDHLHSDEKSYRRNVKVSVSF